MNDARDALWQAVADATADDKLEELADLIDGLGTPMFTVVVGTTGTIASLSSVQAELFVTMPTADIATSMAYVLEQVEGIHAGLRSKVAAARLMALIEESEG